MDGLHGAFKQKDSTHILEGGIDLACPEMMKETAHVSRTLGKDILLS